MGINRWKDRRGRDRIVVSKYWPDKSRSRLQCPNMTVAKKMWARIEESVVMGTWRDLRSELLGGPSEDNPTLEEFSKTYLREYCRTKNTRPDFKEQSLATIRRHIGKVRIKEFRRAHAYEYIAARSKEVRPATVNRGLAVLKNMLTFAIEKGLIESHPMARFSMLPEEEKALRVLTLEEERRLVDCVSSVDRTIGAYVALLGETALRKSEGLRLEWRHIDFGQRLLSVEKTKSRKARYVPLSDFAVERLGSLVRVMNRPEVFICLRTHRPWKDPREAFAAGKEKAELGWVGLHDLRHFRATQWVMQGIDLRTVKELLGHADIQTTMRYAHFAPSHAFNSVRAAQQAEALELESSAVQASNRQQVGAGMERGSDGSS